MNTSSPEGSGNAAETRREMRWLMMLFAAMIVFGAACWFAFPHVMPAIKGWLGRRHLGAMKEATQKQEWNAALIAMRDAKRWAPEDPAIIHASIDLMVAANGDPRTVISLIRQLQHNGDATSDDLARMGRMHVRVSESDKARAIYTQIPPQDRNRSRVLMLQADLQAADGKRGEAVETRRAALMADTSKPENLLQLASLDLASNDPSRRTAIRQRLWQAARDHGDVALPAIDLLASTKDLTSPQAEELLKLVESDPAKPDKKAYCRLKVLSAQMRISPQLRTDILQAEISRWSNRQPGEIAPLVLWLAELGEHARILRMMPAQTAARYTDLLPAYVAALRGEKKWQELDQLLKAGKIDPAFPVQKIRLWQAEVQSHLDDGDVSRARQTLVRVFEESGRGDNLAETLEAAALAEQLNLWDLAQRCYQALAAKHPQIRPSALPKVYQMAEYQHDGATMLQACSDLLALQPDSAVFRIQKLYLQMLIGSEIEIATQNLQSVAITGSTERMDQIHLLHALSAYRQGRLDEMRATMPKITKPENLPPGQRTVYAAFLKLSDGDAGRVFRLVERVSPLLLLPEEKTFLQRAL
jgi:hypothetical protein